MATRVSWLQGRYFCGPALDTTLCSMACR